MPNQGITKQGAAAIDEIVMGMQLSGVDKVRQLLTGGFHNEAIKEANRLSPDDLRKLAAELNVPMTTNEVEQTDSAVSPPKKTVEQEHELDENSSLGEPNSQPESTPAPANADINPVEGAENTDEGEVSRAPTQIPEEATPPGGSEDPKAEHPTTTVPDNEVSVATKEGAECDSGEPEKKEDKPEEPKEEPKGEPKEEPKEEPVEEIIIDDTKTASLQGYVKGSHDAVVAILKALQNGGK